MRTPVHLLLYVLLLIVTAWLAGCGTSPKSRFYALTPLAEPKPSPNAPVGPVISVAPVEIPDYLDRPEIVTREGANGVKLAEFDRWAGSLGENMTAVLAENLALLLGTERVFVDGGAPGTKVDAAVVMRVLRLDCLPGDRVFLKVQWTVSAGGGKSGVTRVSTVTEKLGDSQYETVVAAVNRAMEQVSRQTASQIQQLGETAARN